ncbi:MAG: glycosyltransferase [Patescibacteria group bacterium]
MKVILINHLYPFGGGAEAAVMGLVQLLTSSSKEVAICTLGEGKNDHNVDEGVQIIRLNTISHRLAKSGRKDFFFRLLIFLVDWVNIVSPFKIFSFMKEWKPDIVHTHNVRGMGMWIPVMIRLARWTSSSNLPWASTGRPSQERPLFRERVRFRWIHTVHDIQLVYPSGVVRYPNSTQQDNPFRIVYEWAQRLVWDSPDVVVSPSEFLKKFYTERGFFKKSKFEVIPNVIMGTVSGNEERKGDKKSILFIGALEESKGVHVLLEAARKLEKEFQQYALSVDIIGDGSLRRSLVDTYARYPWIHFHGVHDSLASFFTRALVTVIPSLTLENAPMAILESFHFGVPVIASRIGGIPEYVKEGETGWLFKPGSADELGKLLKRIIEESVPEEVSRNCQRVSVDLGVRTFTGHAELYRSSYVIISLI